MCIFGRFPGICSASSSTMATRRQLGELPASGRHCEGLSREGRRGEGGDLLIRERERPSPWPWTSCAPRLCLRLGSDVGSRCAPVSPDPPGSRRPGERPVRQRRGSHRGVLHQGHGHGEPLSHVAHHRWPVPVTHQPAGCPHCAQSLPGSVNAGVAFRGDSRFPVSHLQVGVCVRVSCPSRCKHPCPLPKQGAWLFPELSHSG